jgi:uncharacterized caspase-like protein
MQVFQAWPSHASGLRAALAEHRTEARAILSLQRSHQQLRSRPHIAHQLPEGKRPSFTDTSMVHQRRYHEKTCRQADNAHAKKLFANSC